MIGSTENEKVDQASKLSLKKMMWGFNTQLAKCKRVLFSQYVLSMLCVLFLQLFYNFVTSTYNTYLLDLSSPKARQECHSKQLLEPLVKTSRIGTVVKVISTLIQNDYILRAKFIAKMRAYFGKYTYEFHLNQQTSVKVPL